MKHILKTALVMVLTLFVFGPVIKAQETSVSDDLFVYKDDIVNEFQDYIDTMTQINVSNLEFIQEFMKPYSEKVIISEEIDKEYYQIENNQINIYRRGLERTENLLDSLLSEKRLEIETETPKPEKASRDYSFLIWIVVGVLIIVMLSLIMNRRKSRGPQIIAPPENNNGNGDGNDNGDIVVRRKTTSVLKKQSLDDVINNDDYMKLDCSDFCNDSAVKTMYIKNTCIKEIYNMYAEDLRNPDNPKEDGCMVLGRWVYDQKADEYCVSLEYCVFPGDDAVFSEYELSFGAKIKINIMTKLRKLRQETQLQYDLTCWVHSHPGIGVFFSNTDYSLHLLHKHPTHPKFLTAIVVDILTPQQDLGIFTFKRDMSINSKAELKKTYSLEEWYKWAVDSNRNSFKPEDHFNTLESAKSHVESCHGIQLNNGSIIDMGLLVTEHREDFIGNVCGFVNTKSGMNEYVATKVCSADSEQSHEPIGCFIIVSHCSIPSVRKALANQLGKIGFVLVYSTTDSLLTSIPVVNNDLCIDQNFYGEQQLEDLKIWTRRKR